MPTMYACAISRMMMKAISALLLKATAVLLLAAAVNSCGNSLASNPQDIVFPDSAVSYSKQVRPFLGLACAYSGCHGDDLPAAGIRLTSYSSFYESPGLILAGKPDQSRLILIIEEKLPHSYSFQDRIYASRKRGMKTWVTEGAKDN